MFKGIDLFSDTASKPTAAMLQAMVNAQVGDEQKNEDPTTLKLQEMVAEKLGFTHAILLPSSTMANQIALMALTHRGEEIIAAENSHIFTHEAGGPAIHAGLMARAIPTPNGVFTAEQLEQTYRARSGYTQPFSTLVSIENTSNLGGGTPWTHSQLTAVIERATQLGLHKHMDGARLFNASIATGVKPQLITAGFDTVNICLSKGLGCPMGAVLVFNEPLYERIRHLKQLMGGAMRQSGYIAAAAIYALENNIERLAEDHHHAYSLATILQRYPEKIQDKKSRPRHQYRLF